ncbi:cobalamin B12-binding domain-containing protein [Nocardioides sp. MAHUQ-72]|uniref:cobalamin B12-binding domain-containing protein n=1 Tax=unclassified Nocardioides TaxID=2615069 RepID=UPI0036098F0C
MTGATAAVEGADLDAYWSAVASGDERTAHATAAAVRERGVPLDVLLDGLVIATQRRVGALWAAGEWTVAREHAATAVNEAVVRRLGDTLAPVDTGPLLAVACVEREWHSLPALVVAVGLQAHGCRVAYLGPSASRDHLVSAILDTGPRAVLLSASLTSSLPRVRRAIEAVRGTGTPVVVGGRAFDDDGVRAQRLGATGFAPRPEDAVRLVASLPVHAAPVPALRHPGALEARSIEAEVDTISRDVIAAIGATLGLDTGTGATSVDDWRVVLATFVPHLVDCLAGALLTEDPRVVAENRGWLEGVLAGRGAPPGAVRVTEEALRQRLHDHPEAVRLLDGV